MPGSCFLARWLLWYSKGLLSFWGLVLLVFQDSTHPFLFSLFSKRSHGHSSPWGNRRQYYLCWQVTLEVAGCHAEEQEPSSVKLQRASCLTFVSPLEVSRLPDCLLSALMHTAISMYHKCMYQYAAQNAAALKLLGIFSILSSCSGILCFRFDYLSFSPWHDQWQWILPLLLFPTCHTFYIAYTKRYWAVSVATWATKKGSVVGLQPLFWTWSQLLSRAQSLLCDTVCRSHTSNIWRSVCCSIFSGSAYFLLSPLRSPAQKQATGCLAWLLYLIRRTTKCTVSFGPGNKLEGPQWSGMGGCGFIGMQYAYTWRYFLCQATRISASFVLLLRVLCIREDGATSSQKWDGSSST